ncbi:MAG: hypothetical protein WA125_02390 [Desulfosporosinus sp.]
MKEQLKVDQEFIPDKIDQMSNSFVKYFLEMASTGEKMDESHMEAIFEIVLIKHGTNLELPDDFIEIVNGLKQIDDVDLVLNQFPESEVERAFEQIRLDLHEVKEHIQQNMDED